MPETPDPLVLGAARHLATLWRAEPQVAVVLGSGLGAFADRLADGQPVSYADIPGFPLPTVAGHAGRLVLGRIGKTRVVAMQGRLHLYEGLPVEAVTFGVRVFAALGAKAIILTTASGGINRHYRPGDLMVIEDQLSFQMRGPTPEVARRAATGETVRAAGPVYAPELVELALRVARRPDLPDAHAGVFAGMLGPTYETPAEVRMTARLGADAISMSTVLEALTAHALGMKVVGVSAIVNPAAGLAGRPLNHQEVLDGARQMEKGFLAYLEALVPEVAAAVL